MYAVTECCLESRMRFRTSRGVPEWSGGKDLYMESCCSGSGKSSVFSGIVPGSFRKVSEDSGGVRRSGKCSTTSNTAAWAVGGRPNLNGPRAPAPRGPCAKETWGGESPKGGRHLRGALGRMDSSPPSWPHPFLRGRGKAAPPPLPCPYIKGGEGGAAAPISPGASLLPATPPPPPVVA